METVVAIEVEIVWYQEVCNIFDSVFYVLSDSSFEGTFC